MRETRLAWPGGTGGGEAPPGRGSERCGGGTAPRPRRQCLLLLLLGLWACDDDSTAEVSDTSRGAIIDAAVRDVEPDGPRILDAQREPEPDAKPDILDFAVPRGDALSACDEVGRRICVVEGERAVRVCEDTGFWRDSLCPAGSVCQGGACMEENEGCRTGERACLAQDRPGVCGEDGDFRAEAACVEGEVCAGGWSWLSGVLALPINWPASAAWMQASGTAPPVGTWRAFWFENCAI